MPYAGSGPAFRGLESARRRSTYRRVVAIRSTPQAGEPRDTSEVVEPGPARPMSAAWTSELRIPLRGFVNSDRCLRSAGRTLCSLPRSTVSPESLHRTRSPTGLA